MKTTMDMSSYKTEQNSMEIEYEDEIMCAGWNPAVDLVCEQLQTIPNDKCIVMEADFSTLSLEHDVSTGISELFLKYRCY